VIVLLGALGCVPRVHVDWATSPELASDAPQTFAVRDEAGAPEVADALVATLRQAGRLREGCRRGAEALVRLTWVQPEVRVDAQSRDPVPVRVRLPGGEERVVSSTTGPAARAEWQGRVHLGWTVEGCDGATVEADKRGTVGASWDRLADDAESAREALPDGLVDELKRSGGHALARRLVPTTGSITRRWYKRGDPRLRLAAAAVREGHWSAAAATWRAIVTDPQSTAVARARAHYDLALHHEVRGQYPRALREIRAAEEARASPAILRYRQALEQAWTRSRILRPHAPLDPQEAAAP